MPVQKARRMLVLCRCSKEEAGNSELAVDSQVGQKDGKTGVRFIG